MSRKFIIRNDYMENEKEQFFSPENSADSEATSSGENNIAYTRKLSLQTFSQDCQNLFLKTKKSIIF